MRGLLCRGLCLRFFGGRGFFFGSFLRGAIGAGLRRLGGISLG